MDQERARELQGKLVQQAVASLVLTGSGEDVDAYEQVVALIGKAWDLPMSGTAKQLALIEQERETMQRIKHSVWTSKRRFLGRAPNPRFKTIYERIW